MPTYRVFIDDQETGNYVSGDSFASAYFDVASVFPLSYQNKVRLEEIDPD